MSRFSSLWIAACLPLAVFTAANAADTVDLSGVWQIALDREDKGSSAQWYQRDLNQSIHLPGSVQEARFGDPISVDTKWTGSIFDKSYFTAPEFSPYRKVGNIKVPFWLQPETHYVGAACYQRQIDIPASWANRRVVLTLERPHWKTSVWLDDREIGTNDANSVAHVYELGDQLTPGRHKLTIRVDNQLIPDIGENSHSVSDHTQGNWNGIVGRIELSATQTIWIDQLNVFPEAKTRVVTVRGRLGRTQTQPWPKKLRLTSPDIKAQQIEVAVASDGTFEAEYKFDAAAGLWDEFSPALHTLSTTIDTGERCDVTFGFRKIAADGRQLTINDRKLFLRGTLDCAIFPKTGHPPTDVASWKKVLSVIKDHGLNHVRYHSWCPPEAAFTAADELGVYLQVEVASWPNWSTTLGDGKPVDAWTDAETARILRAYGNHPSFLFLCAGNEPGGKHHAEWLAQWVARQKAADPRRLYTAGAGWPELPQNDYHIRSEPRIQHWEEGLASRINSLPPETRTDYTDFVKQRSAPVVSHEIGQWCVYPNFAEMSKYTGYLHPKNFEIFQASLQAKGLGALAHSFLIASGKLQALCYKEEIESALRTPEMGGFQLLSLQDFPGQGTALVGILDPFWEEKGYISAQQFRRFCNSTVPLARFDKRVFTTDEHLSAEIEVSHFGPKPLPAQIVSWQLVSDNNHVAASGSLPPNDIAIGGGNKVGRVDLSLQRLAAPARYRLLVTLEGTPFANDWDIWVYPKAADVVTENPANVLIASQLDAATQKKLQEGGTVWLALTPKHVRTDTHKPIALGFSSIFWNTAWTNGQAPHTLGVLCDPRHPALAHFPTDAYSNWQWWYPLKKAAPMILDPLPAELTPIVQIIDDWTTNRKLALAFEAHVGSGRVLVTSIDMTDAVLDPVRRQLRSSLLAYAASRDFQPKTPISLEQLQQILAPQNPLP